MIESFLFWLHCTEIKTFALEVLYIHFIHKWSLIFEMYTKWHISSRLCFVSLWSFCRNSFYKRSVDFMASRSQVHLSKKFSDLKFEIWCSKQLYSMEKAMICPHTHTHLYKNFILNNLLAKSSLLTDWGNHGFIWQNFPLKRGRTTHL